MAGRQLGRLGRLGLPEPSFWGNEIFGPKIAPNISPKNRQRSIKFPPNYQEYRGVVIQEPCNYASNMGGDSVNFYFAPENTPKSAPESTPQTTPESTAKNGPFQYCQD